MPKYYDHPIGSEEWFEEAQAVSDMDESAVRQFTFWDIGSKFYTAYVYGISICRVKADNVEEAKEKIREKLKGKQSLKNWTKLGEHVEETIP